MDPRSSHLLRRALPWVVLPLGLLSACTNDEASTAASRTTTTTTTTTADEDAPPAGILPEDVSVDELVAALPAPGDVDVEAVAERVRACGPDGAVDGCPSTPDPPDAEFANVLYTLRSHPEDPQPGASRKEAVFVEGARYPSTAAAEGAFERQIEALALAADGPFATEAKPTEGGGYDAGQEGTGKGERTELDGLSAYELSLEQRLVDLDGVLGAPEVQGIVVVTWGRHRVIGQTYLWGDHHDRVEALEQARSLVREYLAALGRPAPAGS